MAKKGIPDPLVRRHLIEADLPPARALALAEEYMAEGRVCEAVVFLKQAEARERLEELREQAVADGDPFLLRQTSDALDEDPGTSRWRATGEAARAAGREVQARDAERMAHLGEVAGAD